MQNITSMRNPVVQAAKALQSKAGRVDADQFLCDGEHMVAEALQAQPDRVRTVFVQDDCVEQYADLLTQATQADIYTVPAQVLAAISQVKTSQGIAAMEMLPPRVSLADLGKRIVLLENVQDPGNVGGILRTADAAGFTGCILTPGCADPFSPKALRATMGSIFRVPIAQAEDAPSAAATLAKAKYAVIASVLDGQDFYVRASLPQNICLMVGNEGAGISPQARAHATHLFRLPMQGGAESLNAGVAAAVFMYELVHRG